MLWRVLKEDSQSPESKHDFGHNVLPKLINEGRVYGFNFRDINKGTAKYWRDIGTLDAYYDANMDLVSVIPIFSLYDRNWPLRTNAVQLPPAKFVSSGDGRRPGIATDSIVAPGSIISGGTVRRSVLSYGVRLHSYSEVEDSILFPNVTVGRYVCLRGAIVDSGVTIPEGTVIGFGSELDRENFVTTEAGRIVVTNESILTMQTPKARVSAHAANALR